MPFTGEFYKPVPKTDEWATPQTFFDALNAEFGFTLDVAANESNAKCETYYTPEQNGLYQPWVGTVWCNPPYGREIGRWVGRAVESALNGATVVMLIFARPDTAWWHSHAMRATEIRFVRGRLRFGDGTPPAPAPSAILVFRPGLPTEHPKVVSYNPTGDTGQ